MILDVDILTCMIACYYYLLRSHKVCLTRKLFLAYEKGKEHIISSIENLELTFFWFLTSCLFCFSQITDLLVNITKHVVWPKHEILAADEKQTLVKKYNVEDNQVRNSSFENSSLIKFIVAT